MFHQPPIAKTKANDEARSETEDYQGRWFTMIAHGGTGPSLNSIPCGHTRPFFRRTQCCVSFLEMRRVLFGTLLAPWASSLQRLVGGGSVATPRSSSRLRVTMTLPMAMPTMHTVLPLYSASEKAKMDTAQCFPSLAAKRCGKHQRATQLTSLTLRTKGTNSIKGTKHQSWSEVEALQTQTLHVKCKQQDFSSL